MAVFQSVFLHVLNVVLCVSIVRATDYDFFISQQCRHGDDDNPLMTDYATIEDKISNFIVSYPECSYDGRSSDDTQYYIKFVQGVGDPERAAGVQLCEDTCNALGDACVAVEVEDGDENRTIQCGFVFACDDLSAWEGGNIYIKKGAQPLRSDYEEQLFRQCLDYSPAHPVDDNPLLTDYALIEEKLSYYISLISSPECEYNGRSSDDTQYYIKFENGVTGMDVVDVGIKVCEDTCTALGDGGWHGEDICKAIEISQNDDWHVLQCGFAFECDSFKDWKFDTYRKKSIYGSALPSASTNNYVPYENEPMVSYVGEHVYYYYYYLAAVVVSCLFFVIGICLGLAIKSNQKQVQYPEL